MNTTRPADLSPEWDVRAQRWLLALAQALGWDERGPRAGANRARAGVLENAPAVPLVSVGGVLALAAPTFLWARRPWGEGPRPARLALARGRLTRPAAPRTNRTLQIQAYTHPEPFVDGRRGAWTLLASLWPPAHRRLQVRLTTWWLAYTAPDGQTGTVHLSLARGLDGTARYWMLDTFAPRTTLYTADATEAALVELRARALALGVELRAPRRA